MVASLDEVDELFCECDYGWVVVSVSQVEAV